MARRRLSLCARCRAYKPQPRVQVQREPGCVSARWSASGETSAERTIALATDTSAQLAEEAASRDGVLWTALTGRSTEAFADAGDAVVLDQFFGSAGIDLAEMLGGEQS